MTPQNEFYSISNKVCHCVILLNVYLTMFKIKATDFIKSMFCAQQYTLCFVVSETNAQFIIYKPIYKHLENSYLGFSLFLLRLCGDKLNRSHLHIEVTIYSLLYIVNIYRNNKGPNIDPWGTPQSIFAIQEYLPWTFCRKLLLKGTIETNLLNDQKI